MAFIHNSNQRRQKRPRSSTSTSDAQSLAPSLRATKPETESYQLFDIFTKRGPYSPIFKKVTSILPVADILSLQRTCKATAPIYKKVQATQWSIDRRLKRFFRDPLLFRWTLGINDALVFGSFALQFFGEQSPSLSS